MNDLVHPSVPVPESVSQEHHRGARSYAARVDRARAERDTVLMIAVAASAVIAVAAVAAREFLPLTNDVPYVIVINHETDEVTHPIAGVENAAQYITPRMIHADAVRYIMTREGYVPQTDETAFRTVRDMSTLEVFNTYKTWTMSHDGPKMQRNMTITIGNVVLADPVKSTNGTITFPQLRFDKYVTEGGAQDQKRICDGGSLSLQINTKMWLPSQGDVDLNPFGTLVIAYDPPTCHFEGEK